MTILYFVIAIGVLVLIHELGHFIVARRNNIRVEKFSIGFGPPIASIKRGETEYKIAPIPLGGYVKMTGEDPEDESTAEDERSFSNKSAWTRIRVTSAGPVMNIALAFILMPIVFLIGRMEPRYLKESPVVVGVQVSSPAEKAGLAKGDKILGIDGHKASTWDDVQKTIIVSTGQTLEFSIERGGEIINRPVTVETLPELRVGYVGIEPIFFIEDDAIVGNVMPDGAAAKAGIKRDDKITAINDEPIGGWIDMISKINALAGQKISLTVEREGARVSFDIQPVYNEEAKRWMIGIAKGMRSSDIPMIKRKYGPIDAVKHGFEECSKLIELTFAVLKKLVTLQLSYKSLGGPIQIAQASAAAAKYGLAEFIYFMAFLSIQLGVLNLLPIPILDGGHILFCTIEGVARRKIPARVRSVAQYTGLVFILSLFLLITVNDIDSVWGLKNIIGKLVSW